MADTPVVFAQDDGKPSVPIPIFSYCKTRRFLDVLIPGYYSPDRTCKQFIETYNAKYPWRAKREALFARYTHFCKPRDQRDEYAPAAAVRPLVLRGARDEIHLERGADRRRAAHRGERHQGPVARAATAGGCCATAARSRSASTGGTSTCSTPMASPRRTSFSSYCRRIPWSSTTNRRGDPSTTPRFAPWAALRAAVAVERRRRRPAPRLAPPPRRPRAADRDERAGVCVRPASPARPPLLLAARARRVLVAARLRAVARGGRAPPARAPQHHVPRPRRPSKPRHSPATSRRPARPRLSACNWRGSERLLLQREARARAQGLQLHQAPSPAGPARMRSAPTSA